MRLLGVPLVLSLILLVHGDEVSTASHGAGAAGEEVFAACSDPGDDCRKTKCCNAAGETCYQKNAWWGGCKKSCAPGIDPNDPPKWQTPWTCKALGSRRPAVQPVPKPEPRPRPPPAPPPPPAPSSSLRRRRRAVSAKPSMRRRRRAVKPASSLRRRRTLAKPSSSLRRRRRAVKTALRRRRRAGVVVLPKPRPQPRPRPRPAPPVPAPQKPAGPCSDVGEDCSKTKCCNEGGMACYQKSKWWAGCKETCAPGIDPNDDPKYQTPWTCKQLGSKTPGGGGGGSSPSPRPKPSPGPSGGGAKGQSSGKKIKGHLTMWATNDALIGSQCEYANAPVNSKTDPMLPSYLRKGFHCAIGDANPGFGKGEHCGKCYRIESTSDRGTGGTPGKKGSAIVSVSNGGAGGPAHFDCIMESFQQITGANTGIFDVYFEEVTCDDIKGGIVPMNWADKNAYYCKMMFENVGGWGSLHSVEACLNGNNCKKLQLFAGATWTGCPTGTATSTTWKFTQKSPSGVTDTTSCTCAGAWPWDTGYRCEGCGNF